MQITVQIEASDRELIPEKQSVHSSGYDLKAAVEDTIIIQPGERKLVPTGIKVEIPEGFEGQIRPRSGLALKHGITLLNAPGTIDADYRGEVGIIIYNAGKNGFSIKRGDRIAQIVFCAVASAEFIVSSQIGRTDRGDGGFGSTGT